ncbi:MAG: pyridoxal 5'-phosphate synthase glutaminase subunit PdxT [Candidatus Thermoplasmatota archaeon]|nr:pyridoxal 5'-phosphate synthase glutaminase subunit PdxT [Candidatus Thermoplasmatota archaeon]MCL5984677.1 pyridoxal 5'-phosphate synthase glutaminase subunit PdxT [Candidatus Thermoplasmatota archaeon]
MPRTALAGVLALQGDVPEHKAVLVELLGQERVVAVRSKEDLANVAALIIPGGESTTFSRLLDATGLRSEVLHRVKDGMGILATCAGLILVATQVERSRSGNDPKPLGLLDVSVRRNDYGRQVDSFEAPLEFEGLKGEPLMASFIRAPRILKVGKQVHVLALYEDSPVAVRQENVWGLTFHPEISGDTRVHRLFLQACKMF